MKIGDKVLYKSTEYTGVIVSNYLNDFGEGLWIGIYDKNAFDFIIETTNIPGRWSPNPSQRKSHGLCENKQYLAVKESQVVVVDAVSSKLDTYIQQPLIINTNKQLKTLKIV